MASPPIGSGRLQPRPPCKGVAGCVQAPCKGRPPAGAATARGYDRLWPDRKGLPLEGTHVRGGCPRRARKGRPTPDSIIVAKERDKSWNIHFHVGILILTELQEWQQVHDEPSQQRPTLLPAGVATLAARVAAPWQGGCHPQRAVTASAG
ncbi:hypothetical protein GW17_00053857 [Ensete ventricosum]|nr:hypothetical protein GW17_00053857 [Ensete ventricosum]